jgi:hypothetical protein
MARIASRSGWARTSFCAVFSPGGIVMVYIPFFGAKVSPEKAESYWKEVCE